MRLPILAGLLDQIRTWRRARRQRLDDRRILAEALALLGTATPTGRAGGYFDPAADLTPDQARELFKASNLCRELADKSAAARHHYPAAEGRRAGAPTTDPE